MSSKEIDPRKIKNIHHTNMYISSQPFRKTDNNEAYKLSNTIDTIHKKKRSQAKKNPRL